MAGATARIVVDGVSATRGLPAVRPDAADRAEQTRPPAPPRPPDAISDTVPLRLPGRRPAALAARAAVGAMCAALALTVLAAAYRAAWKAAHVATPNLVGRTVADAGETAQTLRLGLSVSGTRQDPKAAFGVVLAQDPPPGVDVAIGTVLDLTVSQGSGVVPDLGGQTIQQASGLLERVGLRLGQVSYAADDRVDAGRIVRQYQPAGTQLGPNAAVDVLVSQGLPPVRSPTPPSPLIVPSPLIPPSPSGPPGRDGPIGPVVHEHRG